MDGLRESWAPGVGVQSEVRDRDGVWLQSWEERQALGPWSKASHCRSGVTTGSSPLLWALSTPLCLVWRVTCELP